MDDNEKKKIGFYIVFASVVLMFAGFVILAIQISKAQGVITGFAIGLKMHNDSLCNVLFDNKVDDRGYCIIDNKTKYNNDLHCRFMNFTTIGERDMTFLEEAAYFPQKVYAWSFTGCW